MPIPVIVHGNPCDGITIIGPFESPRSAEEWAKANLDGSDGDHFWSTPLYSPDEILQNRPERIKSGIVNQTPGWSKIVTFDNQHYPVHERRRSGRLAGIFQLKRFRLISST
jgi:hypothetical protein